MNKVYEFTLFHTDCSVAKNFYVIGGGTLEDGIALIKEMHEQFLDWGDRVDIDETALFTFRTPSDPPWWRHTDDTPIYLWEGADILASDGTEDYYYEPETNQWELQEKEGVTAPAEYYDEDGL